MSSELQRLCDRGWVAPQSDARGGKHTSSSAEESISYPEDGLAALGLDGGSGYWFNHRAREVARELRRNGVTTIWDIGAGAGSMAIRLSEYGFEVVSIEPIRVGAEAIAAKGLESFWGTLHDLGLPDESITASGLFDVIEHLERPADLLLELNRVTQSGGRVTITVPAGQWLWGDEDEAAGHFRRYSKRSLDRQMRECGFEPVDSRFLFTSLVPLAWVTRRLPYLLGRRRTTEQVLERIEGQLQSSYLLDRFARAALECEYWFSTRVRLPFGLSIVGVYRRV